MEKRPIGKTGEKATILGFGCMRLPLDGPKPCDIDIGQSTAMLRRAIDGGVNYVDTAYAYHSGGTRMDPGASEPFVAQALKGGYREKVLLATKLPCWLVKSHADMHRLLDEQLRRLDVRHLDFYLAHSLNDKNWGPMLSYDLFGFFEEAMRDGRIRFPAFSFHDDFRVFEVICKGYDWAFAQIQYNYLDTEYQAGLKGLRLAGSRGMGVVVMEPLRGGFLARHLPEEAGGKLKGLHPDWSLASWAFKWVWAHPEVSTVLSGMNDMSQVEDNLKSGEEFTEAGFSDSDGEAVLEVARHFQERLQVNCTQCKYCMPCPSGVDIPKNLGFLNQYYFFDAEETKKRCMYYYALMIARKERASNCTACGECVEKCPQAIEIPAKLSQTAELYASVR
jgi:predicted aldo/keto reductase-like oxidoreductase